jgi:hypothetical protein
VYKATSGELVKETDVLFTDEASHLISLINLSEKIVSAKTLVSGGHTVVNLRDRLHVGSNVVRSVSFCMDYILGIQNKYKINSDFLIMLNDFYMEKDAGTDLGKENQYRKEAISPYILPTKINELIIAASNKADRNLSPFYCSEKNMADRFKRYVKENKKRNKDLFYQNGNDWYICHENGNFKIIENNKPNCAAGNAATFRAVRYDVSSNKIKTNYNSFIGIFPLCSLDNVLNGYIAACKTYSEFELPSLLVFFGKSCFN